MFQWTKQLVSINKVDINQECMRYQLPFKVPGKQITTFWPTTMSWDSSNRKRRPAFSHTAGFFLWKIWFESKHVHNIKQKVLLFFGLLFVLHLQLLVVTSWITSPWEHVRRGRVLHADAGPHPRSPWTRPARRITIPRHMAGFKSGTTGLLHEALWHPQNKQVGFAALLVAARRVFTARS